MTKNEVIKYIDSSINFEGTCGFICISISREDIAVHYPHLVEKFDKLSNEDKETILSRIAYAVEDMVVEYDLSKTLDCVKEDAEDFVESVQD